MTRTVEPSCEGTSSAEVFRQKSTISAIARFEAVGYVPVGVRLHATRGHGQADLSSVIGLFAGQDAQVS